jgi:TonB-dependent starch-binding outer membrane protein SusC
LLVACLTGAALLIGLQQFAQNKVAKWKVTDEKGAAISGASVVAKDLQQGSASNENGEFALQVPASATTLTVTAVGFEPRELAVTDEFMDITLVAVTGKLDEVVEVGSGIKR